MKNNNCNIEFRNTMFEQINKSGKLNLDFDYAIVYYMRDFEEKIENRQEEFKVYKILALSTFFLDAFKILNLKKFKGEKFTIEEKVSYELLKEIKNFKEIEDNFLGNEYFLKSCIKFSYQFKDSSVFEKILSVKALSSDDNSKLLSICPNHQYDVQSYNLEIDKDFFAKHINVNINLNNPLPVLIEKIKDFLANFNKLDEKATDNLIKEIINCEYKLNDITIEHMKNSKNDVFCEGYYEYQNINNIISSKTFDELKEIFFNNKEFSTLGIYSFLILETKIDLPLIDKSKIKQDIANRNYSDIIKDNDKGIK